MSSPSPSGFISTSPRPRTPGFTMVEVILALGIMGIAIISVLGLIAPTLSEVQYTQDLNEGTACISRMNSLLDSAPFWNSVGTASGESVWQWIAQSHSNSPTVFIFYNEIPSSGGGSTDTTPVQRVARFNVNDVTDNINAPLTTLFVNVKDPTTPRLPLYGDNQNNMADFLSAVNESRIAGPVIAMTLSLSPLAQHFPISAATSGALSGVNEQAFYVAPAQGILNGLFSDSAFGQFPDPDGLTSGMPYPEAYLPIYIQAFSISIANLSSISGTTAAENQILDSFSTGTRLFTYTTAKLR